MAWQSGHAGHDIRRNFDWHQGCTALAHVSACAWHWCGIYIVALVMMYVFARTLQHVPYVNVAMAWANDMCMESNV